MYNRLIEKVAKHLCLINLAWFWSLQWSLGPYAQSYLKNIPMVMIICVCEGQLKRKIKMHGTSHYTKYGGGGSLLMRSLYPFVKACFCVCSIPLGFHITLLSFQKVTHTCMCYVHNFDWHFVCAPMPHPMSPHQIHIWKRGFYWALNLNWLWFGNLAHTYKLVCKHAQYSLSSLDHDYY